MAGGTPTFVSTNKKKPTTQINIATRPVLYSTSTLLAASLVILAGTITNNAASVFGFSVLPRRQPRVDDHANDVPSAHP